MEKLIVEVRSEQVMPKYINIEVDIDEVTEGMNKLPMTKRWSHVANILNEVETDIESLTPEHRRIVKNFLEKKLKLFQDGE